MVYFSGNKLVYFIISSQWCKKCNEYFTNNEGTLYFVYVTVNLHVWSMSIMSGAFILNNNKLQYRAMAILYLKSWRSLTAFKILNLIQNVYMNHTQKSITVISSKLVGWFVIYWFITKHQIIQVDISAISIWTVNKVQ